MKIEKGKVGAMFMAIASAYVANTCIYEALQMIRDGKVAKAANLYRFAVKRATDRAIFEYEKSDVEIATLMSAMFKGDFGPQVNLTLGEGLEHNRARLYDAVIEECADDQLSCIWGKLVVAEALSEISVHLSGGWPHWRARRNAMQNTLQEVIDATRCPRRLFKDLRIQSIGDQIARQFLDAEWIEQVIKQTTAEIINQKKINTK